MNKFGKIMAGTLSVVLGAGAVGGVCYSTIPSFKNKVNEIVRKDKIKTNNKANISVDPPTDIAEPSNPNEVKPITPEQFKSTYKVDLPSSFLGNYLYVKQLSNDNLLISSSVATSILFYNHETDKVKQIYLEKSSWQYYEEMDNGNVLIGGPVGILVMFDASNEQINCLFSSSGTGIFSRFTKLSTGNYAVIGGCVLFFNPTTLKTERIVSNDCDIIDCGNDRLIMRYTDRLYYFDHLTMDEAARVGSVTNNYIYLLSQKEDIVWFVNNGGIYSFDFSTKTLNTIYSSSSLCNYLYDSYVKNDKVYFLTNKGCYSFNLTSNEVIILATYSASYYGYFARDYKNGNILCFCLTGNGYSLGLLDFTNESFSIIAEQLGSSYMRIEELSNGDFIMWSVPTSSSYYYSYYFHYDECTVAKIASWGVRDLIRLNNGKYLICTNSPRLVMFDPEDQIVKDIFYLNGFESFEKQEDGTILIKTGTGIDYEYDQLYETFRLVYTATQES